MIGRVFARELLDSRGNPTVECELQTNKGVFRAMVPSGASTGTHEALELRDGGNRYHGQGVQKAVKNVNDVLAPLVLGKEPRQALDQKLLQADGTPNKRRLGANAILSISMAISRAAAADQEKTLYEYVSRLSGRKPSMPAIAANVVNGGMHAGNALKIQEYLIIPKGASSFTDGARMVSETYHELKKILKEKYGPEAINVGDEGGFAPPLSDNCEPFELISQAIEECGYAKKIFFGLDAAATNFYEKNKYVLDKEYSGRELVDYYLGLAKTYPILWVEDPFAEDDFESFAALTSKAKFAVVGDDLVVTNPKRIKTAIQKKACNCLLVKLNQIGTVSEAINAVKTARSAGWTTMVSHRSGETEDAFLADFAVGVGSEYVKIGAPARSDRTAKYNQLMRLEEQLTA
ncbi:phosphopyruvate hydratase [Candidatus Micrarchaeota archaeon CG_4_10_14_0_2_um_filter_55_9]|nr:MAG: phosphopyruvate hydratase [Candidatus Micrarchaeota archaeon CG09_land_8_20_14_0_10_55_25]PIZ91844.1 MAG: phosphopyruvate hydratase [Candidatus Micrarchaeota archaeon CG_4_10_14_0_2_um_filter_55_9]